MGFCQGGRIKVELSAYESVRSESFDCASRICKNLMLGEDNINS